MNILKGFTLAEVLITLGIIGVVAAITMPTLIANYQEKQTVTKLKQTYSILSQAILSTQGDLGTPDDWGLSGEMYKVEDSITIAKNILPTIKILQDCGTTKDFCTYTKNYKYLDGRQAGNYGGGNLYRVVLNNGTSLSFGSWSEDEIIDFFVDINGTKAPNTIGKDLFCFAWFKKQGLYPLGTPNKGGYSCNKNSDGWGCTYNVMYYENMNYLK